VNLLETVSTNIRYYRKSANFTQEALGVKSKLSSDYLSRLERGEENISILSLERIAKALKIPPHLLLVPESYKAD
jgi:transcriptional regulator with XRE-family HTH domain